MDTNINKIIFLDIDGVLVLDQAKGKLKFSRDSLINLARIVNETGAQIVLSSSWKNDNRKFKGIINVLKVLKLEDSFYGIVDPILPENEEGSYCRRADEIENWLNNHKEIEKFIIIDDDRDILGSLDNKIIVDSRFGIKEEHVLDAINILDKKIERKKDYDLDNRLCR